MTTIDPEVRDLLARAAAALDTAEPGVDLVDEIRAVLDADEILADVGSGQVVAVCIVCGEPIDLTTAIPIDPARNQYVHPEHAAEVL